MKQPCTPVPWRRHPSCPHVSSRLTMTTA
uniref:Uncharacterized protein n=1 Tax=Arundo donax TaxID=35708 RepID=A0A0A9B3Q9_ARUDO